MPFINGCKYSCEPCIRGHRATSCAHTDRILIEVRKPGRPLQSCGHQLDSCSCGRLAEAFSIGDAPISEPFNQEPGTNYVTTKAMTPTLKPKPKPKDRVAGKARVAKIRATKTASPTISLPSDDSPSKTMPVAEKEKDCKVCNQDTPHNDAPDNNIASNNVNNKPDNNIAIKSWQHVASQDLLPEFSFKPLAPSNTSSDYTCENAGSPTQMLPPITPLLGATNMNSHQDWEDRQPIIVESPYQINAQLPSLCSSRIEDISIISNGQSSVNRHHGTEIRSRYITTTANSMRRPHGWQA